MKPAWVVFAVAAVGQWIVPLVGVWQQEQVIAHGVTVKIRCVAPDPYDPIRGRYLAVRPQETTALAPPGFPAEGALPVWATLVSGEDGLARIESLSLEPITGPTVIRLTAWLITWRDEKNTVRVNWPFDRLYLNERIAPDADRIMAARLRDEKTVVVAEVRLLDGRAVLMDILIGGVSVRDIVKQVGQ